LSKSKDELYIIGVDFKNNRDKYKKILNTKNPSWNDLNESQGFPFKTGEHYRQFIKKRQDRDGTLKKLGVVRDEIVDKKLEQVRTIPNYKESVEIKSDNSQVSDKLLEMSLEESKDPDFVLKSHGYSPSEWSITSAKNSMWHMNTKEDGVKVLYSSKVSVKPRTEYQWNEEDAKKIFSSLETCTRTINKSNIKTSQYKKNGKLLIVPISDFHLNLLSDKLSTGNEYNMQIAEDIFFQVINDVIDRVEDKVFEKVLFVTGNDFITADNTNGTTTRGTPQEVSASWFKAVHKATELIVRAIDMLTEIAPVDVILVPSNHDLHTMFGVIQTVKAWYRGNDNVYVDDSHLPRKYYEFGKTLLTFSHDIKVKDALQIITTEAKDKWSNCEHIVLMLAHLHQAMVYEKQGYLEVLRLPTVSGFSRWSNDKGYIQTEKKNQSFIVSKEYGITDILNTVIGINRKIKYMR